MKYILDGIRAGVMSTLVLTLWSFFVVDAAMGSASDAAGLYYILTAFGLLGALQLAYGAGLGVVASGWEGLGRVRDEESIWDRLADPERDLAVAAGLLSALCIALATAAVVAGVHLFVTSKFVRPIFQAASLALVTAGSAVAFGLLSAWFVRGWSWILRRIPGHAPKPGQTRSRATRYVLLELVALMLLATVFAYFYAKSLNVWPIDTIQMGVFALLATPVLMGMMTRLSVRRIAWTHGVPLAGAVAIVGCFVGAINWSSATPEMREAVNRHGALVSVEARFLQNFADADGDGFPSKFGGRDCDDTRDDVFPGARETPGNGVDEDCSGADAEPPSGKDHPSRKIVARAHDAGAAAAHQAATNLPEPPKNLLVLLVDTLRYDHLGFAGYERNTSPNMDALAQESTVFTRAYATSPHTPRSIPAIFLSRYASRTKWRGGQYNYPKVRPENLSLYEILDDNGYYNVGVSSHFYFDVKRGLQQGFDTWNNEGAGTIAESNADIASPRIWERLEPLIEELGQKQKSSQAEPFSLFVHLFEPHAQWIRHKEYPFEGGDSPEERHKASYDSEIAFVDAYVGKILKKLEETGLADETVIVLVSDHGEAFNEHGYFFHGQTLYEEVIHVPLLIRVPGWFHRRVDTPVSIVDIAPTVLDLFGYAAPEEFDGTSLVPAMVGQELRTRPIYAELLPYTSWKEHHKAVIYGDKKFISVFSAGTEELYDLASDPGEKKNLVRDEQQLADEIRKHLEAFMQMP